MLETTQRDGKTFASLDQLTNWSDNPRELKRAELDRLKKQIKKLGEYKSLLVTEDGTVLGGNSRLKAYKELGMTHAWVSVVEADTETKKLEYALSDNDHVATYDEQMLAELVTNTPDIELGDYKVDLGEPVDLSALLEKYGPEPEIVEDEAPEPPVEPKSKLGEVYQLGRHRLVAGDATKIEDVERLMGGVKADMVFTDPPYGYSYQSNHQTKHEMLLNDDTFLDFLPCAYAVAAQPCAFYVFCGWQTVDEWIKRLKESALELKNIIVWKKNNWSMGDLTGAYAGQYEMCLFAHKGRVELQEGRDRDVWEFNREPPTLHPTMKPIELCARGIRNTTKVDQSVLDLFGGSGSTLIACEQTNRTCYMMEISPAYIDVIITRWETLTGQTAVLLEDHAEAA
jgi:DNA modification methylase